MYTCYLEKYPVTMDLGEISYVLVEPDQCYKHDPLVKSSVTFVE